MLEARKKYTHKGIKGEIYECLNVYGNFAWMLRVGSTEPFTTTAFQFDQYTEYKEPRKAETRYVPVFEWKDGTILISSETFITPERARAKYNGSKIIDIIEINYTEKV